MEAIFLPGWSFSQSMFANPIDGCRVINIPGGDFDDVVERLAGQLNGEHLIAWSMAGLLAVAIAGKYPEHISSLTLIGSRPNFRADATSGLPVEQIEQLKRDLQDDVELALNRFDRFLASMEKNPRAALKHLRALRHQASIPNGNLLADQLCWLREVNVSDTVDVVRCPVRVIVGELDKLAGRNAWGRIDWHEHVVPEAGHLLPVLCPDYLESMEFLRAQ